MFWSEKNFNLNNSTFHDVDIGKSRLYNSLTHDIKQIVVQLELDRKGLILLFCNQTVSTLTAYISALRSGHAVLLAESKLENELKIQLIKQYKPDFILAKDVTNLNEEDTYSISGIIQELFILKSKTPSNLPVYKETALLLSTSGTTGSNKFVRLSYNNIQEKAESICQYLNITSDEVAITSMPTSYSFGLSIINTHLLAGADIVFTDASLIQKEFWEHMKNYKCTSLSGVPFTFNMLERLRVGKMDLPHLKTLTQAGGRLPKEKVQFFNELSNEKGVNFFVMYGQTEASPRMSYIPPSKLEEKFGSVGIPVPNGKLSIVDEDGAPCSPNETGEIRYSGPNVMLGYAESRKCLQNGDDYNGVLLTGDLGYLDQDGYLCLIEYIFF